MGNIVLKFVITVALTTLGNYAFSAQSFDIAHIREQGQDMILIPLNSSFGARSNKDQREIVAALDACATSAKLGGEVVVFWEFDGKFNFMGPKPWHPFLKSIDSKYVAKRINKKLTCG
jgi:hypothetical protein